MHMHVYCTGAMIYIILKLSEKMMSPSVIYESLCLYLKITDMILLCARVCVCFTVKFADSYIFLNY